MEAIVRFQVFCIEQYKNAHHMRGNEAYQLFEKYGVMAYLSEFYDVLHSFGAEYLVQEIDLFVEARQ